MGGNFIGIPRLSRAKRRELLARASLYRHVGSRQKYPGSMRYSSQRMSECLNRISFPVDVYAMDSDYVAFKDADIALVEALAGEEAIVGLGSKSRIKVLRLSKRMGELRSTVKLRSLPIAEDCRTVYRESLGNGRFTFSYHGERIKSYSPDAREIS